MRINKQSDGPKITEKTRGSSLPYLQYKMKQKKSIWINVLNANRKIIFSVSFMFP